MKITLDKDLIYASKIPTFREKVKQFKAAYTDGDLLRMYKDSFQAHYISDTDILKCEVSAYQSNSWSDTMNLYVEMVIDELIAITRIKFFVREDDDGLFSCHEGDADLATYKSYK